MKANINLNENAEKALAQINYLCKVNKLQVTTKEGQINIALDWLSTIINNMEEVDIETLLKIKMK